MNVLDLSKLDLQGNAPANPVARQAPMKSSAAKEDLAEATSHSAPCIAANQIDPLWTVHEVAGYFRASRSWVYQRAESGVLPCVRIGGLLRFDPKAMLEVATKGLPR